jgi:glycosyltransferase involved in cell wall biosynthesis
MIPGVFYTDNTPLVSVVIPCFNHACFLSKAIESVLMQTYKPIEIVVVDDGSADHTKEVAGQYQEVKYIYQENKGLSAARNTGARNSTGEFVLFLDADDWLYPKGIEINVKHLLQHKEAAFVSGTFDAFYIEENAIREGVNQVDANHYCRLLRGNYIGMIATVLFRRWVFEEFLYDTTLKNCEDYDLYMKVARKYPVCHHLHKIAAYRFHASNMSANIPLMLQGVLNVLQRQKGTLRSKEEKRSYYKGRANWKKYYCEELYQKLLKSKEPASGQALSMLLRYKPALFFNYISKRKRPMIKSKIKTLLPVFGQKWLHKAGLFNNYLPAVGEVDLGHFSRIKPFSKEFGYDRGGPVDRYYIESFLDKEAESIQGRVLEIGDNNYTLSYGGNKVVCSDILHVDESNPNATLIGDISNAPQLPDNLFDCIILTQTLHLIYDFKGALTTCYRILKPGGILLLTVPGLTPIDHGEWKNTWYWSFTDKAMHRLMDETFPGATTEVKPYGNVLVATAFLYGMGLQEVPLEKLAYNDPQFQVVVSVKARKAIVPQ